MKKRIGKFIFVLCFALLSLTSCTVNWVDRTYEVPWWVIVIPSVLFVVIAWWLAGKHISSQEYVCPECGKKFYPKWRQAAFSVHMNDDRVLKCPHCGKKGFCPLSRDREY